MELFCAQKHGGMKREKSQLSISCHSKNATSRGNEMKKLQLEDSTIIEDSAAILAEQKNYYKKLYSRSENKSNEEISNVFFNNPALTELNKDEKKQLRGAFVT